MQEKIAAESGLIYHIIFPGLRKFKYYFIFFLSRVAYYMDYSPIKVFIYRLIGIKIGREVFISPDVILDVHFPSLITIKDYCIIGWGAKLFIHEFMGHKYRIGRILIEEGAIIGAFSTIRGGVSIGKMAEIPYGSIIYQDVLEYTKVSQFLKKRVKNG